MRRWIELAVFLAISLGGGLIIGSRNTPDDWYRGLAKPWFNPPDWVFAPAWTILYVLIAVAGWLVWRAGNRRALTAWGVQMALNLPWSPLFFTARATGPALVVILGLLAALLVLLGRTASTERAAFRRFLPYAVWVSRAALLNGALLNGAIRRLNG